MSAALRAAIAAKRAALKQAPTVQQHTPVGSQESNEDVSSETDELAAPVEHLSLAQPSLSSLLLKSCTSGKLLLSSRSSELTSLPNELFDLLKEAPPAWYRGARPWYERSDLVSLSVANNALVECEGRIEEFTALQRLDMHNNRLPCVPPSLSHLSHLTHLNLSGNQLTSFPCALLGLDTLLELDLSTNRLEALWGAADIAASRAQLDAWRDERGADEAGGVWAGFMASQQPVTRGAGKVDKSKPLAGLRVLSLANNRLTNASLGLPPSPGAAGEGESIVFPPHLTSLDVSDNFLRGPLPLELFGALQSLAVLDLGGNGLSEVFSPPPSSSSSSDGATPLFSSLHTLDVHRCEIDDLAPLEATFGSPRAIAQGEKPHLAGASVPPPPPGVRARQLVCAATRRPATEVHAAGAGLFVILEGNPLREEAFRRKRSATNPAGARSVSAEVMRAATPSSTLTAPKKMEPPLSRHEEEVAQSNLKLAPTRKRGGHNESSFDEFGALGDAPVRAPRKGLALAPKPAAETEAQKKEAAQFEPLTTAAAAPAPASAPTRTRRRGAGMEQSEELWGALGGSAPAPPAPTSFGASARAAAPAAPAANKSGNDAVAAGPADWEAPLSEGAKRRLRVEAARKAAEEEEAAGGGGGAATPAPSAGNGRAKAESEWGPL